MAEEEPKPGEAAGGGGAPKEEKPADLKDIVTTDFMKGLVSDLNLDIDQDQMGDLMKEAGLGNKGDGEEEKKEEDPKDPPKDD